MHHFVRYYKTLGLLLTLAALAGCGSMSSHNDNNNHNNGTTVTLTLNPTTINNGQLATLTWTTTSATGITITPSVLQDDQTSLPLNGQATVSPTATTTYTATATGPNGNVGATATLTVNQLPPTLTLTANPASIQSGGTATLTWDSTNATSITLDNNIGSVSVPSGTKDVTPAVTTTYTGTATGPGGTTTAAATVTVVPPAQLAVTLTANPTSIVAGQNSTLTWTSQNANSVSIAPGIGTVSTNGSMSVTPSATTTYTATATDVSGNTANSTATVTVVTGGDLQTKIHHIIFMVEENRSFDDYFGFLGQYKASKGLANDIDGLDVTISLPALNDGGPVHPYHYQTACVENTTPGWNESHADVDKTSTGYKMDGFIRMTSDQPHQFDPDGTRAMGFYNQDDLPYYYELGAQFATSDRFFSSLLGPTIPNRMYLFTATSFGNIRPTSPPPGGWTQPTIFQSLNNAGVLWKYYYQDNSAFIGSFSIWNDPASQGRVRNISEWYSILSQPNADQLLAPVVYIEHAAQLGLDEHPGAGTNNQKGAADVQQILNALMNSSAWQSSIFVLTFDEAGGLYDHVPPYAVPLPDSIPPMLQPGDVSANFDESGMRLPMLVVSPWVKPHFVSHTNRELTSILKLIETRYNLPPLTARDAAADNMLEFFDFTNPAWLTPPPLPTQPTNLPCNAAIEAAPGFPTH